MLRALAGKQFGRLTVMYRMPNVANVKMWHCKCSCGKEKDIAEQSLIKGRTRSCGCLQRELVSGPKVIMENGYPHNYDIMGNEVLVYFTNNSDTFKISLEDIELVQTRHWFLNKNRYVCTYYQNKNFPIHLFIMPRPDGFVVDHINGDKTDNRRCNLRIVSYSQNAMNHKIPSDNTSQVPGVYFHKATQTWYAQIVENGNRHSLGYYKNKDDAIKARKDAEKKYFGEYAFGGFSNDADKKKE